MTIRTVARFASTSDRHGHEQPNRPSWQEVQARLATIGVLDKQPQNRGDRRVMLERDWKLAMEMRHTHSLTELAEMFDVHPSTIRDGLRRRGVTADLRGVRSGRWRLTRAKECAA